MDSANRGSLTEISFVEVLRKCSSSDLTGMIRLESGPVIKVVYFQNGTIAFASSNEKHDRLTEILKRAGKLTLEQVEDAQARLKPNVSLGKTLVELGYISARDLLWGARTQVEGILHELVFWKEGIFQVLEGSLPKEIIVLNLSVPGVIFDAICKTSDRQWVLERIGSPEAIFRLAPDFHEKYVPHKLRMMRADDVVSRVNSKRNLQEIAHLAGMDTFEVCKIAVALQYLSLVEKVPVPVQMDLQTQAAGQGPAESETSVILPETALEEPFALSESELNEPVLASVGAAAAGNPSVSLGQVLEIPSVQELSPPPREDVFIAEPEAGPVEINEMMPPPSSEDNDAKSELAPMEFVPSVEARPQPEAQFDNSTVLEAIQATPQPFTTIGEDSNDLSEPKRARTPVIVVLCLIGIAAAASAYFFFGKKNAGEPFASPEVTPQSRPPIAAKPVTSEPETPPAAQISNSSPEAPADQTPAATASPAVESERPEADPVQSPGIAMVLNGQISKAAEQWRAELSARPQGFIIQILIACQEKTVTDTLSLLENQKYFRLMPLQYHGLPCYRVLFGPYASQEEAAAARNSLPAALLQQPSPPQVMILRQIVK